MVFEENMMEILDNSFEIVLAFDNRGKIVYANTSAKNQLEYQEGLEAITIEDIFPTEFKLLDGLEINNYAADGEERETVIYRGNRTCFSVKAKFRKTAGPEAYLVCYAFDVSRLNLLEKKINQTKQEADEALKIKSEFVSNITHELKTPVNGILGNAKELIRLEDNPDKQKLLRLVERGCDDMHSIIGSVLDFSKLEAGKFELDPKEFVFREMMDYIKSNHIHKIAEKGLELFINVSPGIPEKLIGDDLRIEQVLNNLISNAIKFTHVGKIMIETVKTAQYQNQVELFFFVIDTGIGIAKEDMDKLFKSFSQVDASISRQYGGTGLGLNICKQIVGLMNGNISVESEVGKGSVFSFNIWLNVPENEEVSDIGNISVEATMQSIRSMRNSEENIVEFGTEENTNEIKKKMQKLILCMEMDNWEKAEMFAESLKQLTQEAPKEVKTTVLKLKMAVQKEDYEKATANYEELKKQI